MASSRWSVWWAELQRRRAQRRLDAELAAARESIPVSVIRTTTGNPRFNTLNVRDFEGLLVVHEVKLPDGSVDLRCRWDCQKSANHGEARLVQMLGATGATREHIGYAKARPETGWRRWLGWGKIAAALAGAAALVGNLDELRSFIVQVRHEPEMTLEALEMPPPLVISSVDRETRKAILRGDPLFRTSVSGLTMRIAPHPGSPETKALDNEGKFSVLASRRSVDVGDALELPLVFDNLPTGRYQVSLEGTVATGWKREAFGPTPAFELESRSRMALRRHAIHFVAGNATGSESYSSALVDFELLFGKPKGIKQDVRVVIEGDWSGYALIFHPRHDSFSADSKNSTDSVKDVIFSYRGVPSEAFSSQFFRVELRSAKPLGKAEWANAVLKYFPDVAQ